MKRVFYSGDLKEDETENADETYFTFNMDNGKTLAFIGDKDIRYADLVSSDEPITMMVLIKGGKNATSCPPILIFKSNITSYPIRGVPGIDPGLFYRTSPKGWKDYIMWNAWLAESRAIGKLPDQKTHVLNVDKYSSPI